MTNLDRAVQAKACLQIIAEQCPHQYAREHAQIGLSLTGDALRRQCLYTICNMSDWRGDLANATRRLLRRLTSEMTTQG